MFVAPLFQEVQDLERCIRERESILRAAHVGFANPSLENEIVASNMLRIVRRPSRLPSSSLHCLGLGTVHAAPLTAPLHSGDGLSGHDLL